MSEVGWEGYNTLTSLSSGDLLEDFFVASRSPVGSSSESELRELALSASLPPVEGAVVPSLSASAMT